MLVVLRKFVPSGGKSAARAHRLGDAGGVAAGKPEMGVARGQADGAVSHHQRDAAPVEKVIEVQNGRLLAGKQERAIDVNRSGGLSAAQAYGKTLRAMKGL